MILYIHRSSDFHEKYKTKNGASTLSFGRGQADRDFFGDNFTVAEYAVFFHIQIGRRCYLCNGVLLLGVSTRILSPLCAVSTNK